MSISLALIPFAIAAISNICVNSTESKEEEKKIKIKTDIKDKKMLLLSLYNYGYEYEVQDDNVVTHINGACVTFKKNQDDIYDVFVIGKNLSIGKSEIDIKELCHEYKKVVQEDVYKNLLENAEDKGMKLENEEVLEDNSILLTFDLER